MLTSQTPLRSSAVLESARDSGSWSRQAPYLACQGAELGQGPRPTVPAAASARGGPRRSWDGEK